MMGSLMKRVKTFIRHNIRPTIEDICEHSTQYGILAGLGGHLDHSERSQEHQRDLVDIRLPLSLIGERISTKKFSIRLELFLEFPVLLLICANRVDEIRFFAGIGRCIGWSRDRVADEVTLFISDFAVNHVQRDVVIKLRLKGIIQKSSDATSGGKMTAQFALMPPLANPFFKEVDLPKEDSQQKGIKAVLLGPPGSGKGTQIGMQFLQISVHGTLAFEQEHRVRNSEQLQLTNSLQAAQIEGREDQTGTHSPAALVHSHPSGPGTLSITEQARPQTCPAWYAERRQCCLNASLVGGKLDRLRLFEHSHEVKNTLKREVPEERLQLVDHRSDDHQA
uniref:(California timema) hypothetical protein n=1 Tax=Timema californicum TaxID=61474 RepID=A0A7R9P7S8_TIMCA|nr:unnamed protein product [Timema californicum]